MKEMHPFHKATMDLLQSHGMDYYLSRANEIRFSESRYMETMMDLWAYASLAAKADDKEVLRCIPKVFAFASEVRRKAIEEKKRS